MNKVRTFFRQLFFHRTDAAGKGFLFGIGEWIVIILVLLGLLARFGILHA